MTEPRPRRRQVPRAQRCRGFELAGVLGVVLAAVSAYDGVWPAVVVGIVGAGVALVMWLRLCRAGAES